MARHTMAGDVEGKAREAAGNWRKFESFVWDHAYDADADDWCIVYTSNRDSGLLDKSNEAAIAEAMEPFFDVDDPDIRRESHNHWAVGHVDGYAIRVYRGGEITAAFRAWRELQEALEDYPVLDEEDYSRRRDDAYRDAWEAFGAKEFADDLAKEFGLSDGVRDFLRDTDEGALMDFYESIRTSGVYHADESDGVRLFTGHTAKDCTRDQLAAFLRERRGELSLAAREADAREAFDAMRDAAGN